MIGVAIAAIVICTSSPAIQLINQLVIFSLLLGLSAGLHQCGVAESRWAIEKVEPAARAYALNATNCTVFTDDCNELLKLVMEVCTNLMLIDSEKPLFKSI